MFIYSFLYQLETQMGTNIYNLRYAHNIHLIFQCILMGKNNFI